jgi:hypothetical protein
LIAAHSSWRMIRALAYGLESRSGINLNRLCRRAFWSLSTQKRANYAYFELRRD